MRDDRERLLDIQEGIERLQNFGIDQPVVWSVVENDLPLLKDNIQQILDSEPDESTS